MTVAIITDTHFGIKNDAPEFVDHQVEFYTETFFPTLVERGIKTILHLGDIFDRRKYTNHNTLHRFRECFFDKLVEHDIKMYLIVGNHDTYFKSTNDVNAPSLFLEGYDNHIVLIEEPCVHTFGNTAIQFMPWINSENYHDSIKAMKNSPAGICMGHFEIRGFEMNRGGGVNTSGLKAETFDAFHTVFSGHFHEPSTDGRISYLGAPYEYTWSDYGCDRGFYIYTPDENELEYIRTEQHMFHRIMYDENFDPNEFDVSTLTGKIVRVIVAEKDDNDRFEDFVEAIEHANPYNFEVIDNSAYHIAGDVDEDALKNEDTLGIVTSYVQQSENALDKEKLNNMFKSLYVEALAVE